MKMVLDGLVGLRDECGLVVTRMRERVLRCERVWCCWVYVTVVVKCGGREVRLVLSPAVGKEREVVVVL